MSVHQQIKQLIEDVLLVGSVNRSDVIGDGVYLATNANSWFGAMLELEDRAGRIVQSLHPEFSRDEPARAFGRYLRQHGFARSPDDYVLALVRLRQSSPSPDDAPQERKLPVGVVGKAAGTLAPDEMDSKSESLNRPASPTERELQARITEEPNAEKKKRRKKIPSGLADAAVWRYMAENPDSNPTAQQIADSVGIQNAGVIRNCKAWKSLQAGKRKKDHTQDVESVGETDEVLEELSGKQNLGRTTKNIRSRR